jgi:hypothetical protein
MRVLKTVLIILGVVLLAGLIGGVIAYYLLNNRNFARPEAVAALESDNTVIVTTPEGTDWQVFAPVGSQPETGFIIYPGGFVDPLAYAPIARAIAEAGFLVILDPMPLNLAVLDYGAADGIIAAFPDVDNWAIGGHSLGGAMASQYIAGNPEAISGLALWASYPAEGTDLSQLPLEVVSIYGDADGVADIDTITGAAERLPRDTIFVMIPGGNHTQFGFYGEGLQRGDNVAGISREEQQMIVIDNTVQMLELINQGN